jgi:DNA polymerase elongation subunit (family B)
MTANNEKIIIEKPIQDFDAVSLYPSAMKAMPGIPKGKPKVLTEEQCATKSFLHYDAFYLEINITKLVSKNKRPYRFPLVFTLKDGIKTYVNEPVEHFYVDKRGLEDLIEFYDIEYDVLRGYYFDEGYNPLISEFIQKLFDLRAKYKKEKNPLQQTIKLLLNSIYGKSILKPVKTEKKVIDPNKLNEYVIKNYNFIEEIVRTSGNNIYVKEIKPINKHFNCPQFGVSVLSWSKHIMNSVMCLADQIGLDIYYQDTDSMHIEEEDVPKLAEAYKEKYGTDLIGSNLGQFHCDFDPIVDGIPVHSVKLIALGKKSYLDVLEDKKGNRAYHIRMKGIPQPVLFRHCHKNEYTMEDLYMELYEGHTIEFNLLEGSNCFRKNKSYEMFTPDVFLRKIHF